MRLRGARLAVFNRTADGEEYRHILARVGSSTLCSLGDIIRIDNMAVEVSHDILRPGHLLLDKLLHCGRIGNDAAIENDSRERFAVGHC